MSTTLAEAQPQAAAVEVVSSETALATLEKAALSELNTVDAGLARLRRQYRNKTYDVGTADGLAAAKKARADIRDRRYKVPHIVKQQKAAIKTVSEKVDAVGERIVAALLELENPIHEQIKAEEDRKAAAREAKEREAREAQERIDATIAGILSKPADAAGLTAADIAAVLKSVEDLSVTLEEHGEHAGRVEAVKNSTIERLETMHAAALAHEQEAAAQAESRARLAADREQLEREQREHDERMAAQRAEMERNAQAIQAQAEALAQQAAQQLEQTQRIERERKQRATDVDNRIGDIRALPATHAASPADLIATNIATLHDTPLTAAYFDGRVAEAEQARDIALQLLRKLHADALEREAEAAAESERQRAEAAAAQARRQAEDAKRAQAPKLYEALENLLTCEELRGPVCVQTALLIETAQHVIQQATPTPQDLIP